MKCLLTLICFLPFVVQLPDQTLPITLDNVTQITELTSITDSERYYSDVAFHPESDVLAVIAVNSEMSLVHDGEVVFLDGTTLREIPFFREPVKGMSITYSPDGTLFAAGSQSGQLMIFNVATQSPIMDEKLDDAEISDISINPANTLVAVAIGTLSTVQENQDAFKLIDIASGDTVLAVEVADSPLANGADGASVAFLNAETLALATTDGIVRVWHIPGGEEIFQTEGTMSQTRDIVSQNNGERIAYIDGENVSLLSSADELVSTSRSIAHAPERNFIRSIAFHPSEPLLAIGYERELQTGIPGDRDGVIRLWNPETDVELIELEGHTNIVTDLTFSPSGTLLASTSMDGTVRLWGIPATDS